MKKMLVPILIIFLVFTFMYHGEVRANTTTIEIKTQEDFVEALAQIHSSSNEEFIISVENDIEINNQELFTSTSRSTIDNGNTVTIRGNGNKLSFKLPEYDKIQVTNNAILNLGTADGNDTLTIEGPGETGPSYDSLITIYDSTVNMYSGVTLTNNHSGYAMLAGCGVEVRNNATFNMYGGAIKNNATTTGGAGGAVCLDYANGTFNMYGGEIKNNEASEYGGAIYVGANSTLNITGGNISNNKSGAYGGAIMIYYGNANIDNATFKNNESYYGGAFINIYGGNNADVIKNSVFENNKCQVGGAICNLVDVTSQNNIIRNNEAVSAGAGIYSEGNLESTNDDIYENTAEYGAGVYIEGGTANLSTTKVYNNKATKSSSDYCISANTTQLSIIDAASMGKTATIDSETLDITGWFNDEETNRYSTTNYTDKILTSEITAGNEYNLIAATNEYKINYDDDGITTNTNAKKRLVKGSKIRINYNNGTEVYDEVVLNDEYTLDNPTRDDYEFLGWSEETVDGYSLGLKANWEKIKYFTVIFNANDGIGTMMPQLFKYGEEQALTANVFEKENATFLGWNTKEDGTGTDYEDKQVVSNLTEEENGNFDLYAKWKENDTDPEENNQEDENTNVDGDEDEDTNDGDNDNETTDDNDQEDEDKKDDYEELDEDIIVGDGEEDKENPSNSSSNMIEKNEISTIDNKIEVQDKGTAQETTQETIKAKEITESKSFNPKTLDDIMQWVVIFMATMFGYSYLARKTRRIRRPKGKRYR